MVPGRAEVRSCGEKYYEPCLSSVDDDYYSGYLVDCLGGCRRIWITQIPLPKLWKRNQITQAVLQPGLSDVPPSPDRGSFKPEAQVSSRPSSAPWSLAVAGARTVAQCSRLHRPKISNRVAHSSIFLIAAARFDMDQACKNRVATPRHVDGRKLLVAVHAEVVASNTADPDPGPFSSRFET